MKNEKKGKGKGCKLLSLLGLMVLASSLFGATTQTQPYTGDSYCTLLGQTTAAFTISASAYSTDSDSATFKVDASSITIKISSLTAGGSTTNTEHTWVYNLNDSANDTIGELISSMTANTYLTVARVEGCYLGEASTTTSYRAGDGLAKGLSCGTIWEGKPGAAGRDYGNVLGVTKTIYLANSDTLSIVKPVRNGVYNVTQIETKPILAGSTMYLYEGSTDYSQETQLAIGEWLATQNTKTYPSETPVKTTNNYALDYRVVFSTWVSPTAKIQIHYFKR